MSTHKPLDDQGLLENTRYTVIPRTLSFVTLENHLLLLEGAKDKKLWPGLLNGLGGHLEPGENPLSAAQREISEESGLHIDNLALIGVIHISRDGAATGVLMLVFWGQASDWAVRPTTEGLLGWHPLDELPFDRMVPDLEHLLPRLLDRLNGSPILVGHYDIDTQGQTTYHYETI